MTGTVVDATGAVLPNVHVEVTTSAGAIVQTMADRSGTLRFDRLPRASYDMLVT